MILSLFCTYFLVHASQSASIDDAGGRRLLNENSWWWSSIVDACSDNSHDCHADATCIVTDTYDDADATYICECNEGYIGDGVNCVKEDPNDYWIKSQIYTGSDKPDLGNWVNGMMVVAECELGYYHPYPEQCRRVIEAYGATPLLMTNGDCVGISEFEGSWWKGMFCTKHAPGTVINPLPSTSHCANVAGSWRYKNPADGQDWQEMTMVQDGCAGVISGFPDSVQTSVPFRSRVQSPGSSYYPFRLDFDSGFDYEMDDFQDPQPKTLKHKGYTFFKSEQQPACANVAGTWWYHSAVAEYLQPMTIVQDGCAGVISGFPVSVGQTVVPFLSDEVQDVENGASYRLRFDLGSGYDVPEMGSFYDREPMIFEYGGFTFRKSIRQPETIFTYSADGNSNHVIGLVGTETFQEILEKIGKPLGLTFDKVRGSDIIDEFWKHNEKHIRAGLH